MPDLKTILIFTGRSCGGCAEIEARLKDKQLAYKIFNIDDFAQYKLLVRLEEKLGREAKKLPALFWNDLVIEGKPEILKAINELPAFASQAQAAAEIPALASGEAGKTANSSGKPQCPAAGQSNATAAGIANSASPDQVIRERFSSIRIAAIIGAGLADGINPCAFATIVFLMGCLTTSAFGTKKAVIMGLSFCSGVFITYFLIGAGACKTILCLQTFHSFKYWFHNALLAALGVIGLILLIDAIHTWRNGGKPLFALPESTRLRINALLARGMHSRNLIITGLLLGGAISLLELACTGQVYLPTIAFVMEDPALASRAYSLLLLYNLMFILPLLGVFLLCLAGIKTSVFRNALHSHAATAKLFAAAVFFGMIYLLGKA